MSSAELLSWIGVGVGAVVWLVRLEGRINGHDKQHDDHARRHDEMRGDIAYIRDRIDRAIGRP